VHAAEHLGNIDRCVARRFLGLCLSRLFGVYEQFLFSWRQGGRGMVVVPLPAARFERLSLGLQRWLIRVEPFALLRGLLESFDLPVG
jgi:hypothetical protein